MKKYIVLFLMMVLLAGTVTTVALPPVIEKCKTCGLPIGRCKYKGKHPAPPAKKCKTCGKTVDKCPYGGKHPTPPAKKCETCGKTVDKCPYGGKHPSNSLTQEQSRVLRELEDNMVWVEGGTFTMGATSEQGIDAYSDEKPAHQVTLSGFYICKYEVTQELWQAVMGTTIPQQRDKTGWLINNINGVGANYPMYYISWDDCQELITKLNKLTGKQYRLPTEAEWEYAARGGNRSNGYKYAGSNDLGTVVWYADNSASTTHPVGTKRANELGLYDMSGNVWEWCADWYGSYRSGSRKNPTGPSSGSYRVVRGGCWNNSAWYCRVSSRGYSTPAGRSSYRGLRLAL